MRNEIVSAGTEKLMTLTKKVINGTITDQELTVFNIIVGHWEAKYNKSWYKYYNSLLKSYTRN